MPDDAEDRAAGIRRSYGRGFADAAKALGVSDVGAVMNLAKMRQIEQSLNGQARKVYEAIPIETGVSLKELLSRLTGTIGRPEMRVIEACANNIVERGLATRTSDGRFQRHAARVTVSNEQKDSSEMAPDLKAVPARDFPRNPSPFAELRARITDATNALAEIERLCVQIESESGKLHKLKEALDNLR